MRNKGFCAYILLGILLNTQLNASELKVGFAELSITPELFDEWEDVNDDAQFDQDIDRWTDGNGNNKFELQNILILLKSFFAKSFFRYFCPKIRRFKEISVAK